jgi:hypothetical protein
MDAHGETDLGLRFVFTLFDTIISPLTAVTDAIGSYFSTNDVTML